MEHDISYVPQICFDMDALLARHPLSALLHSFEWQKDAATASISSITHFLLVSSFDQRMVPWRHLLPCSHSLPSIPQRHQTRTSYSVLVERNKSAVRQNAKSTMSQPSGNRSRPCSAQLTRCMEGMFVFEEIKYVECGGFRTGDCWHCLFLV